MKQFFRLLVLTSLNIGLLFCANFAFGQNVEIKWGQEFKEKGRASLGSIIGEDEEYYYLLKTRYKGFLGMNAELYFERYSSDHKLSKSSELKFKTPAGKEGDFVQIYQLDDKFVALYTYYDSKADMNILYAVNVDKSGNQDKPVIVDKEPAKKEKKAGSYEFILSEDKTKILIIRVAAFDKKGTEKFKYIMLKSNLENLWEKEVELPYKDKDFAINKYIIDETGNVFLLGSYKIDKKDKFSNFKVFAYDYSKDKLEDIKINFSKAKFISNLKFFYNNGALHLVGFYNGEKGGVLGIIYNRINSKTFTVENERNEAFDKKTLLQFSTEKQVKKGKGLSTDFLIRDIIVNENGSIRLLAENYFIRVVTTTDSKGITHTTYYYYYLDVIVLQFNKDGKIEWASKIPKYQYSVNDGGLYSGYLMAYDKDNIYLLYNDNPKNGLAPKKPSGKENDDVKVAKLNKITKATIMVAKVDNNGNVERELFSKDKEKSKTAFVPSTYSRMSKDRIWIVGVKGKLTKYGFLTLKGNE